MPQSFLHEQEDWESLIRIVSENLIIDPVLVEKDYWITHVLWGIKQLGYRFALKGGTSLSKGYRIIERFSEDIDILIFPQEGAPDVNQTSLKGNAVQTRKEYYDWLVNNISIPGIIRVERDLEFDDVRYYRSGGIRLYYESKFEQLTGVKQGILLEVGFSKVVPNEPKLFSSWVYEHARSETEIDYVNNTVDVDCYDPGYTFVEKLQTVIRHYRQELDRGTKQKNYMRQFYDIACLLRNKQVQNFIGSDEYENHKKVWITGKDAEVPISQHPAFKFDDEALVEDFKKRFQETLALYYKGQPPFEQIVETIKEHLAKL